jgi:hypothetical protein
MHWLDDLPPDKRAEFLSVEDDISALFVRDGADDPVPVMMAILCSTISFALAHGARPEWVRDVLEELIKILEHCRPHDA